MSADAVGCRQACDCDGQQLDALFECGGDCAADDDGDGTCDDVDPCVGQLDACNVCNGPGEVYECGCADIPEGSCDCDGNQLDAWACVVAIARRTPTLTASVTTSTTAWGRLTRAACATALVRFTNADVLTSLKEAATATATNSTLWACVVAIAQRTPMLTGSVMTWTTVLDRLTRAACATAQRDLRMRMC